MSLSQRNSRPITVDGIDYRWTVSARSQAQNECVLLVIQPQNNGQRLVVQIPCRDPWLRIGGPSAGFNYDSITPGLVRSVIEMAKATDWLPEKSGPELSFVLQSDESLSPR